MQTRKDRIYWKQFWKDRFLWKIRFKDAPVHICSSYTSEEVRQALDDLVDEGFLEKSTTVDGYTIKVTRKSEHPIICL